jgi:hypothetical protein
MRAERKRIVLGILLLGVCLIVWFDVSAHVRKNRLLEVLTQKGTVVLLPGVTEALLSDLRSGDADRVRQWHGYIHMCAGSDSNLVMQTPTVQDAFALYISKEWPARSNHFNRLVFALNQQSSLLSRDALLGYLGDPDFTSGGPDGQVLQYEYQFYGKDCLASAVVSNDVVIRIEVYAK